MPVPRRTSSIPSAVPSSESLSNQYIPLRLHSRSDKLRPVFMCKYPFLPSFFFNVPSLHRSSVAVLRRRRCGESTASLFTETRSWYLAYTPVIPLDENVTRIVSPPLPSKKSEDPEESSFLNQAFHAHLWDGQILGKGPELSPVSNNCNQMSQVAYCRES